MDTEKLSGMAYEAAFVPELWHDFVERLAEESSAFGAAFFTTHPTAQHTVVGTGLREMWRDFESGGWNITNPRLDRAVALQPAGFVRDTDILSTEEIATHPWFTEFCAKWGMGEAAGAFFNLPSDATLILTIERQKSAGPYTEDDVAVLNRLRPDLGRSVDLAVRLTYQQYATQTQVLDALGLPAAVVDASGRLLNTNPLFDRLMPGFARETRRRLQLSSRRANQVLTDALQRLAPELWVGTPASIPIPARDDLSRAGVLHLIPIRGVAHDLMHGGACLLVFCELGRSIVPAEGLLKNLFDLTAAEARVARSLIARRGDYGGVARDLGIGVETIRTHAKSIYRKTGLPNVTSLVAIGVELTRLRSDE